MVSKNSITKTVVVSNSKDENGQYPKLKTDKRYRALLQIMKDQNMKEPFHGIKQMSPFVSYLPHFDLFKQDNGCKFHTIAYWTLHNLMALLKEEGGVNPSSFLETSKPGKSTFLSMYILMFLLVYIMFT